MLATHLDSSTEHALEAFKARLAERYRERLKGIFLFGSRARGDFRPDSDADVAVFLDHLSDPIREQMAMGDDAYDIWMETGVRIEPWAFEQASLADPDRYRATHLVKTIQREGIPT